MAGDDEPIHDSGRSLRSWPQDVSGTGRIHVYDARAKEVPKPPQGHGLRNTIVMPQGVERLGDDQIRYDHPFPCDQRTLDSPARKLHLRVRLADQQAEHDRGIKPDGHGPIPGRRFGGRR